MPATKMLKDSAGNDFYPVTHAAAVVRDSGTLEEALASIPTKNSQIENDAGHLTSVGTADINDKAVTGAKIADKTVGSDKLTDNAVWTENIKNGSVTVSKLDASTIDYSVGNPTSGSSITLTQSWQAIIQSGTLPAGTYLVFCEWYYNVTSISGDMNDVYATIATSAANAATTQLTNEGIYNGWNHGARTCIRRVVLDSNNKIGLYMKRVTTTGTVITTASRCSLNIIRVA